MSRLPTQAEDYVRQQNSPNTREAYTLDLSKWFAFLGKRAPSVALIVAWKQKLEENYAPNSVRRIFATTSAFYDWMRRAGVAPINPFELVKRPRVLLDAAPNVPTDVQVERILRAVPRWEDDAGSRHYAILTLLLNGLRAQEVCDLRWSDLYYDGGTRAWVLRVVGKGMKERVVPLTSEATEAVHQYLDRTVQPGVVRRGEQHQPLFHDVFGGPITRKQVAYVCDKYGKLAGVKGFSPHSFRHHYGTRLYRVTRDVLGVGKLMGHSKPETTQVYARLDLADLVETARLDPRHGVDKDEYDAANEA